MKTQTRYNAMRFATLDEWLVWQETLHPKSIDLGLARARKVFQALDPNPQIPFTLTVAGTNGKGSCVAMLEAMLRAEGYRVGSYTSPHLLRYNERMRIDGECLTDAALCEAFERIDRARGNTSLSFFEFGTLAALDIFSKAALDVQILEVGLGGRLDAVNLIDADGALISSIDFDHQDWLGVTRDSIAVEKAGILRAGRPAIVGDPAPPAALLAYAQAHGIQPLCQGRDFAFEKADGEWNWFGQTGRIERLPLPALLGDHQFYNASAVIQLLSSVSDRLPVTQDSIRRGLESVSLPGRFHYVDGPVPLLLDVAHNPQSVKMLVDYLVQRFPGKRIHAVFAMMRDKDIAGVVKHLQNVIDSWYLAPLKMPRAAPEALLLELMQPHCAKVYGSFADAPAAFAAARRNAQNGDLVVVFGSFFLVAEILAQII